MHHLYVWICVFGVSVGVSLVRDLCLYTQERIALEIQRDIEATRVEFGLPAASPVPGLVASLYLVLPFPRPLTLSPHSAPSLCPHSSPVRTAPYLLSFFRAHGLPHHWHLIRPSWLLGVAPGDRTCDLPHPPPLPLLLPLLAGDSEGVDTEGHTSIVTAGAGGKAAGTTLSVEPPTRCGALHVLLFVPCAGHKCAGCAQ